MTSENQIEFFLRKSFPAVKTVIVFPPRETALAPSDTALIQLHSISLITTLACDGKTLASGDPNSPAQLKSMPAALTASVC